MPENVGYTRMAKCNQLTPLPFKGLTAVIQHKELTLPMLVLSRAASISSSTKNGAGW